MWKTSGFNWKMIYKWCAFHIYVSLQEGTKMIFEVQKSNGALVVVACIKHRLIVAIETGCFLGSQRVPSSPGKDSILQSSTLSTQQCCLVKNWAKNFGIPNNVITCRYLVIQREWALQYSTNQSMAISGTGPKLEVPVTNKANVRAKFLRICPKYGLQCLHSRVLKFPLNQHPAKKLPGLPNAPDRQAFVRSRIWQCDGSPPIFWWSVQAIYGYSWWIGGWFTIALLLPSGKLT